MIRYKKNYKVDGWPIEDTKHDVILNTDDLCIILNNRCALVEALEWALERAEPEVRETDNSMDQMMLIKYQTLLQEVKG